MPHDAPLPDGCRCWNDGQWGRVHNERCPIHGPEKEPDDRLERDLIRYNESLRYSNDQLQQQNHLLRQDKMELQSANNSLHARCLELEKALKNEVSIIIQEVVPPDLIGTRMGEAVLAGKKAANQWNENDPPTHISASAARAIAEAAVIGGNYETIISNVSQRADDLEGQLDFQMDPLDPGSLANENLMLNGKIANLLTAADKMAEVLGKTTPQMLGLDLGDDAFAALVEYRLLAEDDKEKEEQK